MAGTNFDIGSISLVPVQVLPSIKTDPSAASSSSYSFGSSGNEATYRALVNLAVTGTRVARSHALVPGSLRVRVGRQDAGTYADQIALRLTMNIDGVPRTFYLTLYVTHTDGADDASTTDQILLSQAGLQQSASGATIKFVGLSTGGAASEEVTVARNQGEVGINLVIEVLQTELVDADCSSEEFAFDASNCDCLPVCPIVDEQLIKDCTILPALDPIRGCSSSPIAPIAPAIVPPTPGPVGPPGPPGTPGAAGPPGTDGSPGQNGCTPLIIWSYAYSYVEECDGPPMSINVIPWGECFIWVHVIYYICRKHYYDDRYCCDFVYCNGSWQKLTDVGYPTPKNEFHWSRKYTPSSSTYYPDEPNLDNLPCDPENTLWVGRGLRGTLDGTEIGYSAENGSYWYYAVCATLAPSSDYHNVTPEDLAAGIPETFMRTAADPECCTDAPTSTSTAAWDCNNLSPPSGTGEEGEVVTKCWCPGSTTSTTCDPANTLWVARALKGTVDGEEIGYSQQNGSYWYYAVCATAAPSEEFQNKTAECIAQELGETFVRLAEDPECCSGAPDCSTTSVAPTTTSTSTAAPTTTSTSTAAPTTTSTSTAVPTTPVPTTTSTSTSTPTSPCDTLWVTRQLAGYVDGTEVGQSGSDSSQYYYAVCSVDQPTIDYVNMTPECYAASLGDTFIRTAANPSCCSDPPPC